MFKTIILNFSKALKQFSDWLKKILILKLKKIVCKRLLGLYFIFNFKFSLKMKNNFFGNSTNNIS